MDHGSHSWSGLVEVASRVLGTLGLCSLSPTKALGLFFPSCGAGEEPVASAEGPGCQDLAPGKAVQEPLAET